MNLWLAVVLLVLGVVGSCLFNGMSNKTNNLTRKKGCDVITVVSMWLVMFSMGYLIVHVLMRYVLKPGIVNDLLGIVLAIFLMLCVAAIVWAVLNMFVFSEFSDKINSNVIMASCIIVIIVSMVLTFIPEYQYAKNFTRKTNVVEQKQDTRELIMFNEIPVQNISGYSSIGIGSIYTTDEITYWYLNEQNEGLYDTAIADNSKIVFISDEEKPVVEIIEKQEQLITKNNNDGTETVEVIKKTYEYVFYLPESLKQYNVSTTEVTS